MATKPHTERWYALRVLEQTLDDVKDLLLPFDLMTWLKMVVIVTFAGAGFSISGNIQSIFSAVTPQQGADSVTTGLSGYGTQTGITSYIPYSPSVVTVGVLLLALVFAITLVGLIMSFVFVRVCQRKQVSITEHFRHNIGNGMRLFGFQLSILALLIAVTGSLILLSLSPQGIESFALTGSLLLFLLPGFLLVGLVLSLTNDFVVVQMLEGEQGVIDAWKTVIEPLKTEWKQLIAFLLGKIVIGIITSILFLTGILAVALAGGILFIILAGLTSILAGSGSVFGIVVQGSVLAILGIGVLVAVLMVNVPLSTFMRFYTIRVYEQFLDTEIVQN